MSQHPLPRKPFGRLLITGAGGNLGHQLRSHVANWADIVRISDVVALRDVAAHEEAHELDLSNREAVMQLVEGVDAIVHLGGISVDAPFDDLLDANIRGTYNLYEAARKHDVKRIVFASSNHVTGFHPVTEVLDADALLRPDSLYGVTKCFGESLSRYYFDRFGIETVCLRIGSSFAEPKNPRMLKTFLSYRDFVELVRCSLFTERVGHAIAYGVSDNPVTWWSNHKTNFLGYRPRDTSIAFADRFPVSRPEFKHDDPSLVFQGGTFVLGEPMERADR
jgi:uronate dehydrogenase